MRQIPLLTLEMTLPGAGRTGTLDYAETIREVLLAAPPGRGIGTADAMRGYEVWTRIAPAALARDAYVMVEEADYQLAMAKLEAFTWGFFNEEIAALVTALRNAPEIPLPRPDGARIIEEE